MTVQEAIGVMLTISGLVPIGVQIALQTGLITREAPAADILEGMQVSSESIKFLQTLLDRAGWMVVVGLVLIYIGVRCLGVTLFGTTVGG